MAGTLTIACRLPCGFVLEIYGMEKAYEPVMGGGQREVTRAVRIGRSVKLNGFAHKVNEAPPHEIRHGVGLTHGVDADLFYAWMDVHKDSDLVKNGFIFAAPKAMDVEAKAREMRDEKSGLEPLNPRDIPQQFKGIQPATRT